MVGAGRTDAGVHARGQVASAEVTTPHDVAAIRRGLNVNLPLDLRVLAVEDAPAGFHARFSARAKAYHYVLNTAPVASPFEHGFAWHLPERFDVEAMRRAAQTLVGSHDFAAFQSIGPLTEYASEVEVTYYPDHGDDEYYQVFVGPTPEAIHEFRRQCVIEDATHLLSRHLGKAEVDQVANLINDLFGKNMPERQPAPDQTGSSTVIPLHPRGKHLH